MIYQIQWKLIWKIYKNWLMILVWFYDIYLFIYWMFTREVRILLYRQWFYIFFVSFYFLASEIGKITKNYRLGFGAFIDKPTQPFVFYPEYELFSYLLSYFLLCDLLDLFEFVFHNRVPMDPPMNHLTIFAFFIIQRLPKIPLHEETRFSWIVSIWPSYFWIRSCLWFQ